MMSWTLDILLMSDPDLNRDLTKEWENEIERREGPKLKFPIKATAENIDQFSSDFKDPEINEIKLKKEEEKPRGPKILNLSEKNKKSKKKLF